MRKLFLCLLLCVLPLVGCASPDQPVEDDRLQIVTTVFPAYDFARAVAGDAAEVTLLLPPGMDSHSYEPTPADILAVQSCDLFLYLGGESDTWVETILTAVEPEDDCYEQVRGIVKILNYVREADVDDEIPPTSLVREFIGGNSFYRK